MSAIALCYFIIVCCAGLGLGAASLFKNNTHYDLRILVAAPLGLAVYVIVLFLSSRVGFAIGTIGWPVFLFGLLSWAYLSLKKKILFSRRAFYLYLAIMALAVAPFAWPLIKFGFDWLAFVNGDMSYYSLSAARFLHYGYSELPPSGNIFDSRDHSLAYWYFPNILGHRAGADILLAEIVRLTGLTAHQVYMPLLIACHVCVSSGAGAMTLLVARKRTAAMWGIGLVAVSPMLTLEVTKQLLSQAMGLAFLASLCVAYVQAMRLSSSVGWKVIAVIFACALVISYSELLPFFGLFVLVHEAGELRVWKDSETRTARLRTLGVMLVGCMVTLNTYAIDVAKFILLSIKGSFASRAMTVHADGVSLFPHFLVPSGGALLWGWLPFGIPGGGYSLIIVFGLIATAALCLILLKLARRGVPSAEMSGIMLAVAAFMFWKGNGFGLFKLAMFIQPFLLATIVVFAGLFLHRRLTRAAAMGLLGLSWVPAQVNSVASVSSNIGAARVPYASTAKLGEQLRVLRKAMSSKSNVNLYSDTPVRELFLLESYYFRGIPFDSASLPSLREWLAERFNEAAPSDRLAKVKGAQNYAFQFGDNATASVMNFDYQPGRDYFLVSSREFSPINRDIRSPGYQLKIVPEELLKNYLILRNNSISRSYVSANFSGEVSYWGIEKDPLFKSQVMAAIGRYHLYQVVGPVDGSRMVIALTDSMNVGDDFRLPTITVVGNDSIQLPTVGRGSARIFSQPIKPVRHEGAEYIGIDFGREGTLQPAKRSGAMSLFGGDIKSDIRKFVAFARDVSYVEPSTYAAIKRPLMVAAFPDALEDPNLEYSGFFEDGWISDKAFVVLGLPHNQGGARFRMSGMIPLINSAGFRTRLRILVNDHVVYNEQLDPGNVDLSLSVPEEYLHGAEAATIRIESSELQRLPAPDGRPVALHVEKIAIE